MAGNVGSALLETSVNSMENLDFRAQGGSESRRKGAETEAVHKCLLLNDLRLI